MAIKETFDTRVSPLPRLEPLEDYRSIPADVLDGAVNASVAISLKRIADALWGTDGTAGVLQLLNPLDVRNNY